MKRFLPFFALLLVACGAEEVADGPAAPASEGATVEVVPEGKADDYLSTNGREYTVAGTDRFVLPREADESEDAYFDRALEHAEARFVAITYFLNAYITTKSRSDANYGYGGFRTTVRQRSIKADDLWLGDDGQVTVKFVTEIAGPNALAEDLRAERAGDDLSRFDLILPQMTVADIEDGDVTRKYRNFNGDTLPEAERATMTLDLAPADDSLDAFPRYRDMMADGVLDVAVIIGGDYNEKRWDLVIAESLFGSLQTKLKLKAPVEAYADLALDSGPFTGSIDTLDGEVRVEVYVVHPGMAVEEPSKLIEAFKAHASKRDIVIYDGHAGYDASYSGVVVTYQPRTAVSAEAFADLDLPEKQQLFVFNGCKTYSVYPDALYANPKKTPENLDIISTVNFSWLSQMTVITSDLLSSILAVGRFDGLHEARSYARILSDLNRGRSWDVIYGVHGLDDNPHASPWADHDLLCSPCRRHADCPGADSLCVSGVCGTACTTDAGCPDGYTCREVAYSGVVTNQQCTPIARRCE